MDASLINLPHEIFYYIARDMDLISFGAVLLTCKEASVRFGTDLQLQKLAFENTTRKLIHSKAKMPIRTLFSEHLTLMALKSNDVEIVKFGLPNMSYRSILQKIKPMRDKMGVAPVKRQHFLAEVFKYDAHKVLKHLIDTCINELEYDKNAGIKHIIGILSILGEFAFSLSPSDAISDSKSLRYVLSLFKKFEREVLISLIHVSSIDNSYWGISVVPCFDFFKSLLIYQQKFPEFAYNLDRGIPANYFGDKIAHKYPNPRQIAGPGYEKSESNINKNEVSEDKCDNGEEYIDHSAKFGPRMQIEEKFSFYTAPVTPLEFAAYCGSQKVFDLLLEYGATFNPKLPYLAIIFYHLKFSQEEFVNRLTELGADINQPLPLYIDYRQRDILRFFIQEQKLDNIIMLEIVLARGAKSKIHDHEHERLNDPTIYARDMGLLALKAQLTDYKPFQPVQLTFPEGQNSRLFKTSYWSVFIRVYANGTFNRDTGEYVGTWEQVDGKLICTAKKRIIKYTRGGSGGSYTRETEIVPTTFTFLIFKVFSGEFALTEDLAERSIDKKLLFMMWDEEVTNTMYYHQNWGL